MREQKEELCARECVCVWGGRGLREREERKRPQATQLLILFHAAKFSIQHVSLVMERERGRETRPARARERGRLTVDGC